MYGGERAREREQGGREGGVLSLPEATVVAVDGP